MLRVQAFIRSHENGVYEVEAHADGADTPFIFSIPAKNDKEAAMEAIRRVEAMDGLITQNVRTN